MAFGDSDLAAFFADMGVLIVLNGQTAVGFFNTPSDFFGNGISGMEEQRYEIELPSSSFNPRPKPKDTVTVNGTDYRVKAAPRYSQDGAVMTVELAQ